MKKEDAEEWTGSLEDIGRGFVRNAELAITQGAHKALGLTADEWRKQLGTKVRLSIPERRELAKELVAKGMSTREAGAVLGVDQKTVVNDMKALREENSSNTPDINGSNEENSSPTNPRADREAKNKEKLRAPVSVEKLERVEGLHLGDFRELSATIPDESVELVFTDPPYDRESAPLYADAAKVASRILKPGGSMICYTGQVLLPIVVPQMNAFLRYWWTAACVHDGGNQMLQKLGIRCGWKPLLWFVKGTRGDVQEVILDTVSGSREKDAHEWQQAEAEASHFIEKLCSPSGTVVDFFAGGGTTCVAAERLGRKWIAYEIDPKHHASSTSRIKALRDAK